MSLCKPIIRQIETRTGKEFNHFIIVKIFKEFKFHVQYSFTKLFDVLTLCNDLLLQLFSKLVAESAISLPN